MNERSKSGRPAPRRPFIDGIVTDGRTLGVPTHRSYSPGAKTSPVLGAARAVTDGFHPLRQSGGSLGAAQANQAEQALLDEPIVLDELEPVKSKKRRGGLLAKRPPRYPKLRKVLKRSVLGLAALLIGTGAYFGAKLYITERHLFKGGGKAPALASNIDINQLKGEGDGRVNVLLLGIGGPGHDGPDLTDTILLASIDPINHGASLLSIPRDLWVKIPGNGYQKINAAYAYGKEQSTKKNFNAQVQDGLNLLDKTLEPILGIPIHYHVVMDFPAFKQAVDAVGGIDVNVPEQLYDPTIAWENGYNSIIAQKGPQHMNGSKALLYAKSRETSSDFARAERQRLILVALKNKVFTLGTFSNPVKVSGLLSSLGNNIYTDFSLGDIARLYQIIGQIPSSAFASLDMVTPPHDLLTTANLNGLSVVEPRAGLFSYGAIQNYVRNALRDGFLAKENAQVAIYNATDTTGLATAQSNVLKSFGYNVTVVGNTPSSTNPSQTTLVDLSRGVDKYTGHYLEERYHVTAVSRMPGGLNLMPPAGTAFAIILGKDVTTSGP